MSTELSFKWKPGNLERFEVETAEDGFVVEVWARQASGQDSFLRKRVCKSGSEVLELLAACLAWHTSEAKPADLEDYSSMPGTPVAPQFPKFPDTFVRFDIDGTYVAAVFREWGVECCRTVDLLARHIQWLDNTIRLKSDELEPWHAVLDELRAKSAAAVATASMESKGGG